MSWFSFDNNKKSLLVLGFLLLTSVGLLPQTAQACPGTAGGGLVWYLATCTEVIDNNGGTQNVALPAGTVAGDALVFTIVADGAKTITTPAAINGQAWTLITNGQDQGGTAVTFGAWAIIVTGTPPATVAATVSGGNDFIATLMRFTGTGSIGEIAAKFDGPAQVQAPVPGITTTTNENLILRMGGFDDDDFAAVDPATVIAGHTTISQQRSAAGSGDEVSVAHAYVYKAAFGAQAATTFSTIPSIGNPEDWRTATVALRPFVLCNGTNTTYSSGPVHYAGCEQASLHVDALTFDIPQPAATEANDLLLMVVTVDATTAAQLLTPSGWTLVEEGADVGNNAVTGIYWRLATAGAANHTVSWNNAGGTIQEAFGYIMRFTGTLATPVIGTALTAAIPGTGSTTPAVNTTVDNSVVVRIGGFDSNLVSTAPSTLITTPAGYNNITVGRSGGDTAQSVSGAAAWTNFVTFGTSAVASFVNAPTAAGNGRRQSVALAPIKLCSGTSPATGATVDYRGCEQRTANAVTSILVPAPAATVAGDYLLAVVATDGDTSGSIAPPAGWSEIDVGTSTGSPTDEVTLAIFGRHATGTGNHTFTWTGAKDAYAYIMRFTGAGEFNAADIASDVPVGINVATPTFNTAVANTAVVRIGAFDNGLVKLHPTEIGTIIASHTNITQGRATANPATAVSSSAVWVNQPVAGATGTASFTSAPTASEEARTVTLGLRPKLPAFRISHAGTGTTCAPITVTIDADLGNGQDDASYQAIISLSTSNSRGYWAIGDGTGTLTAGPGNGTATYDFSVGDAGDVALQFYPDVTGSVNFNVADGTRVELGGYDPSLVVSACVVPPAVTSSLCEADGAFNMTVTTQTSTTNRLLVVVVGRAGGFSVNPPAVTETFSGVALEQVGTVAGGAYINSTSNDAMAEIYMLSETSPGGGLPDTAGPYALAISSPTGVANTFTCAFYFEDMTQSAPTGAAANLTNDTTAGTTVTTSIDPAADNSIVFAGLTGTNDLVNFTTVDAPLTTRPASLGANGRFQGTASTYTVSYGVVASGGPAFNAINTASANVDRMAQMAAAFAPAPAEVESFRFSHAGSGGTCGPNAVTITAIDQYGNKLDTYVGQIQLDAGATGTWSQGTATNVPVDGTLNDGDATYTFALADAGQATLGFTRTGTGTVDFDVNHVGDTTLRDVDGGLFDPDMVMSACKFRFSHPATSAMCAQVPVTLSVHYPSGALVTTYSSVVNLSTIIPPGPTSGGGGWYDGDNIGDLDDTNQSDGLATYDFDPADLGSVTLYFNKPLIATVNFNASADAGVLVEDGSYDANLSLEACYYRIEHDSAGDVCTPEAIEIHILDTVGDPVENYTGSFGLGTSSNIGDWSEQAMAMGDLTNSGFGVASYDFDDADDGVALLYLTHHSALDGVEITHTGGFLEDPMSDGELDFAQCKLRVSFSAPNTTACTPVTMTVTVYNSANMVATDYGGKVEFETSTGHGNYVSTTGLGLLVDNNPDNGTGRYTFAPGMAGDAGTVDIVFTDKTIEVVNINPLGNDGDIIIDDSLASYDPDLGVTACLPTVSDSACYPTNDEMDAIMLPGEEETLESRMVLMYVSSASDTPVTDAFIDEVEMTHLRTEFADYASDTMLEVFGILDVDLPDLAGEYRARFTGSENSPAMCIVAVEGVAQAFPAGTRLSGTNVEDDNPIETALITTANNSIVISAVANVPGGEDYSSNQTDTLWQVDEADPVGADWAGFWSYQLAAGSVNVVNQTDNLFVPDSQAQIALALAPLVNGTPAVTGYVPVTLFQTYSGPINYRAIGNTLRAEPNTGAACLMIDSTTGSTATLELPAGVEEIRAAYLYWAGSGLDANKDLNVQFGPVGDQDPIIADGHFIIAPNQVYNPSYPAVAAGYFAAYKDVTSQILEAASTTYHFSHLTTQFLNPWFATSSCVGGWALVVVYEHEDENLNVVNLFHGFQPFWHTSFTLVPRNFRMAEPDFVSIPNGQITHVTFEGDKTPATLSGVEEVFELQNDPGGLTFDVLSDVDVDPTPVNPVDNQYNSTIMYPNFTGVVWDGDYSANEDSYGTDIDTYYLEGANMGDLLFPFGDEEAEQITTRYSTGEDIVLLNGEFIVVTNGPIADLEVFVTGVGAFKAATDDESDYQYIVTNNGDGTDGGGYANGTVILTGEMPDGITFDAMDIDSPGGWSCPLVTSTAFTCIFNIATSWTGGATNGQLAMDESLPMVTVTLDFDDDTSFPEELNDVTTIARIAHVGSYASCIAEPAGVQPDPNWHVLANCDKSAQFDNVNDLNKYLIDIDTLTEKSVTNNNVDDDTRDVSGILTNLSIEKTVVGILEANEPATYQLTVTNNGPDATTKTITVADELPDGLVPLSASGTGWVCAAIVDQDVSCTYAASAADDEVLPAITINIDDLVSPAVEGYEVDNTANVSIAPGNFDTIGPNSDTNTTTVQGPVAAASELFLVSLSEPAMLNGDSFDAGDLIMYDPVAGTAELWMDITGFNVDALHLLPNGHLILSPTADGATLAGENFDAEDLLLYDPILGEATLIFDGSAIFDDPGTNLDAVHVLFNGSYTLFSTWDILLSTSATATINGTTFQNNDIVSYDMGSDVATVLVDGFDDNVFNSNTIGDIAALYLRHGDANSYILNTSDVADVIINPADMDEDTQFEQGEFVEIDVDPPVETIGRLCDDEIPCTSLPPLELDPTTAYIDAVHVIETGYFGHFSITNGGGNNICTPTSITITKHVGLGHTVDTAYEGSIRITGNLGAGVTWNTDGNADGDLYTTGFGLAPGEAIYTFKDTDDGTVTFLVTDTTTGSMYDVDATNGIGVEIEDAVIAINNQVTTIHYIDQFNTVAYGNNGGDANFTTFWAETGDDGSASAGRVQIAVDPNDSQSKLRFNGNGGQPALMRQINFTAYTVNATPQISFDYRIAGNPSGSFIVEARPNSGAAWEEVHTFTASSGSGNGVSYPLDLDSALSATTQVRFRIVSGYGGGSEYFYVDNVDVSAITHQCGVGDDLDHYAVTVLSTSMVSCLMKEVTIEPHSLGEVAVAPGTGVVLTLNTTTGRGTWGPPLAPAAGAFTSGIGNGYATYTYAAGEDDITFPFYYTELLSDPEPVSFLITDTMSTSNLGPETAILSVAKAGFRFWDETASVEAIPTLVAGMRSNLKYPGKVLTLQAVASSPVDPALCVAALPVGTHQIEIGAECLNPADCSAGPINVQIINGANPTANIPALDDDTNSNTVTGYTTIPLTFTDGGGFSRAVFNLSYADAGQIQLHARYGLDVLDDQGDDVPSGDYMTGASVPFVVRPFAFDIDFSLDTDGMLPNPAFFDRLTNGNDNDSFSWATAASKTPAFLVAGQGISTRIRALVWDCIDDDPMATNCGTATPSGTFDGVPVDGANLFNNANTPNYGNEADDTEGDMTVEHDLDAIMPMGSEDGELSDPSYAEADANFRSVWTNGEQLQSMTYTEVGIIDLTATLDSDDYLGGGEGVRGTLLNVGRFVPGYFRITSAVLTPRVQIAGASSSVFNYMDEDFGVEFTLTARNALGDPTKNYVGDFARMQPADLHFHAIQDLVGYPTPAENDDQDYSTRLASSLSMSDPLPADFSDDWDDGALDLGAWLRFARQMSEAEDGPYLDVTLALGILDDDMVADFTADRDVDDDNGVTQPGTNQFKRIGAVNDKLDFLYGRLRLENAYGPEIQDLDDSDDPVGKDVQMMLTAEYWDGTRFIANADDEHTPYGSAALDFVANTYNLGEVDPNLDNLDPTDAAITAGISGVIHQGGTFLTRMSENDTPLFLTAPAMPNNQGSVLVELDLNADFLPAAGTQNLNFLRYDWRTLSGQVGDELVDETQDGIYTDNPRARVEFGSFRGNDRIINWQEIFK